MDDTHGMDICLKNKGTNSEAFKVRLSIIIPVYNAEKYIERCLNAILNNNLQDIEIIVVNDGSTDRTCNILEKYEKKYIWCLSVINKSNGGVSSARNIGIEHSHGEWITFVDADDIPTYALLSYIPDNQADLYCFNWQYTSGDTENEHLTDAIFWGDSKQQLLNHRLVDYIFRTPWAKIFRSSIIKENNLCFNESYNIGEDNLFMLDCLYNCQTITTTNVLGYVYLRPEKGKYPLPFLKAANYMTLFMEKYDRLNVNCQPLLLLLNYYFFSSLHDNSLKTRIAWEQEPAIRHLQSLCWTHYGKAEQLKIIIRRLISLFYVKRTV